MPSEKSDGAATVTTEWPRPTSSPQQSQPVVAAEKEEERPVSGGDRKKWEAGVPPVLPIAQQTLEETCLTSPGEN